MKPTDTKKLSSSKLIELDIRNNVLATILDWMKLPTGNSEFILSTEREPQERDFWYQRQQEKLYYCIYFKQRVIAHYHVQRKFLEFLPTHDPLSSYVQKLMDNQFYSHIDGLQSAHLVSCQFTNAEQPARPVAPVVDQLAAMRGILEDN